MEDEDDWVQAEGVSRAVCCVRGIFLFSFAWNVNQKTQIVVEGVPNFGVSWVIIIRLTMQGAMHAYSHGYSALYA
jgi:hypothetical protein